MLWNSRGNTKVKNRAVWLCTQVRFSDDSSSGTSTLIYRGNLRQLGCYCSCLRSALEWGGTNLWLRPCSCWTAMLDWVLSRTPLRVSERHWRTHWISIKEVSYYKGIILREKLEAWWEFPRYTALVLKLVYRLLILKLDLLLDQIENNIQATRVLISSHICIKKTSTTADMLDMLDNRSPVREWKNRDALEALGYVAPLLKQCRINSTQLKTPGRERRSKNGSYYCLWAPEGSADGERGLFEVQPQAETLLQSGALQKIQSPF